MSYRLLFVSVSFYPYIHTCRYRALASVSRQCTVQATRIPSASVSTETLYIPDTFLSRHRFSTPFSSSVPKPDLSPARSVDAHFLVNNGALIPSSQEAVTFSVHCRELVSVSPPPRSTEVDYAVLAGAQTTVLPFNAVA